MTLPATETDASAVTYFVECICHNLHTRKGVHFELRSMLLADFHVSTFELRNIASWQVLAKICQQHASKLENLRNSRFWPNFGNIYQNELQRTALSKITLVRRQM